MMAQLTDLVKYVNIIKKDDRISVIHQSNKGVVSARSVGIEKARENI